MIDRFGVTIDWRGATLEALTTIALQADYSGCGYLWVPEAWGLEAFSSLGHLLSVTKRIKIGPGIANIFSRSAATLAMAAATLNQLAPKRFLLGLGSSGRGLVEDLHGMKFEKLSQRTKEYIEAIRKLESGETLDYQGQILNLKRFRLFTKPVETPTPIYVGAMGQKNLNLAGKIADGAIVSLYPISKLNLCKEYVNGSGSLKDRKIFSYIPLRVIHNEREEQIAVAEISKLISFYIISMGKYYSQSLARLGYAELVNNVKGAQSTNGKALNLDENYVKDFSLIGTPAQIIDRISQIPEGVYPVFGLNASSPQQGDSSAKMLRELSAGLAARKPRPI